ncbi:MAG TPA: ribosome maturation factor RimM [Acidimicrobiales bacterium]|nr:ribosome maturation factor RimM [Acidimicrobiales bacterium]
MPDVPDVLEVGRVAKPHGLAGEVIVALVTNRPERLAPGSVLTTPAGELTVKSSSPHQGRWIVRFAGVSGREAAEALRGTVLSAPALDDPEELWVHELVGCEVVDVGGRPYGPVIEVEANPASDLLVLEGGGLVPLRFVVSHEAEARRIVIDPPEGLLP